MSEVGKHLDLACCPSRESGNNDIGQLHSLSTFSFSVCIHAHTCTDICLRLEYGLAIHIFLNTNMCICEE